ncbi:MAG: N-6 DNA Methylase [Candidatus Latescibacteria bacterium ADurb.Bin168]|nr:MAG: N-6 DNA Methylase [Candidatus Latescibacteria bacterium ADurb.Bin168]
MTPFQTYLRQVNEAFRAGNATEHTYRPFLKELIESLENVITAVNEPRHSQHGAPDFIILKGPNPVGYVEAKDVGKNLDEIEKDEQIRRYQDGYRNLILTDYLQFRWYVGRELRMKERLGSFGHDGRLRREDGGEERVERLLRGFLSAAVLVVATPKELAERMAALGKLMRGKILDALRHESEHGALHGMMGVFRATLLHDLTDEQFADMYAQTICYGLFAARCNPKAVRPFSREHAAYDLPKTNPFLRQLFSHVAGPDLDERITWAVDDLARLLDIADMEAILRNFGQRTRQEDPVVHFYETFLAAYDPKMRELRGVYYTPEPVVGYIVRSVDHILKIDFGLPNGLADAGKVPVTALGGGKHDVHRVQILDPAAGTGTFLHAVVDLIRDAFAGNEGAWPLYVKEHLLPRLFGFELLMAPYTICHMKLGLQLQELGYDLGLGDRLRVYLTNTLEEATLKADTLLAQWLAEEANAASEVKQDAPIMVVLGNPPYSGHSANASWTMVENSKTGRPTKQRTWIGELIERYFLCEGKPLGEQNPKLLHDDYVKFIRFAQWRIERTGYGILAFISNNGYLDNPTFRGMRESLMETFDDIYILDLHGSSKKKEKAPDGGKDENVFDIQQGVAIGIFVKKPAPSLIPAPLRGATAAPCAASRPPGVEGSNESAPHAISPLPPPCAVRTQEMGQAPPRGAGVRETKTIRHAELYGTREEKYAALDHMDLLSTSWDEVEPRRPFLLLKPQNNDFLSEYENGIQVTRIFPLTSTGVKTHRDHFVMAFDESELRKRIGDFRDLGISDDVLRTQYDLPDTRDWKLGARRRALAPNSQYEQYFTQCLYRPFDMRPFFHHSSVVELTRDEVMHHMLAGDNIAISTTRSIEIGRGWEHVFCTANVIQHHTVSIKEVNYLFPLYLYPVPEQNLLFREESHWPAGPGGRRPNLSPKFVADMAGRLGLRFVPDGTGDLEQGGTFGPEDVLHYMYSVFHSPAYRRRYAEYLKTDFPRLPLTSDRELFAELCRLGRRLVALHLMKEYGDAPARYPVAGNNVVEKVEFSLVPLTSSSAHFDRLPRGGSSLSDHAEAFPSPGGRGERAVPAQPDSPSNAGGRGGSATRNGDEGGLGRVWINKTQYFDGVPQEVWEFHIGGYQVCHKWLKDRKGRTLTYDDIQHYGRVVAALGETIRLMEQIDDVIEEHGGFPLK